MTTGAHFQQPNGWTHHNRYLPLPTLCRYLATSLSDLSRIQLCLGEDGGLGLPRRKGRANTVGANSAAGVAGWRCCVSVKRLQGSLFQPSLLQWLSHLAWGHFGLESEFSLSYVGCGLVPWLASHTYAIGFKQGSAREAKHREFGLGETVGDADHIVCSVNERWLIFSNHPGHPYPSGHNTRQICNFLDWA